MKEECGTPVTSAGGLWDRRDAAYTARASFEWGHAGLVYLTGSFPVPSQKHGL